LQICALLAGDIGSKVLLYIFSSGKQNYGAGSSSFCGDLQFDIFLMQIRPLVKPTRTIVTFTGLQYSWHDLVSKGEKAFQNFVTSFHVFICQFYL
jgi:hypothetical protein